MDIKQGKKRFQTSEPYYDFFDGGYLHPAEYLENDSDIEMVIDAGSTIDEYINYLIDNELVMDDDVDYDEIINGHQHPHSTVRDDDDYANIVAQAIRIVDDYIESVTTEESFCGDEDESDEDW